MEPAAQHAIDAIHAAQSRQRSTPLMPFMLRIVNRENIQRFSDVQRQKFAMFSAHLSLGTMKNKNAVLR